MPTIITSISPKRIKIQQEAISSWKKVGYQVISINSSHELDQISNIFDVEFIGIDNKNNILGEPFVPLNAVFDYLRIMKPDNTLIINSDIVIQDAKNTTDKILNLANHNVILLNRINVDPKTGEQKVFHLGFDGFVINKKFLDIFPKTKLCLGRCHWDYWLPYVAKLKEVEVLNFKEPYLFHIKHEKNWKQKDWKQTAEILREELGLLHDDLLKMTHWLRSQIG